MAKHELVKITEQIMKAGSQWIAKVQLRCALEGCRYGVEKIDVEPRKECMYCGTVNPSYTDWWLKSLTNRGVSKTKGGKSKQHDTLGSHRD